MFPDYAVPHFRDRQPNRQTSSWPIRSVYFIFFAQCYFLAVALGLHIDFITITLFTAIANLISLIPISISGLGTREASLIYLFSLINVKPELAVSYALLVFIVFFLCGGIMGAVAFWIKPVTLNTSLTSMNKQIIV